MVRHCPVADIRGAAPSMRAQRVHRVTKRHPPCAQSDTGVQALCPVVGEHWPRRSHLLPAEKKRRRSGAVNQVRIDEAMFAL